MWLLVLFTVTAGIAGWSGWAQADRDAIASARQDAGFGAGKAAEQIGHSLAVVRSTVDGLASNPGIGQLFVDPSACRLAFNLGGADDGHLDVLRLDGTMVCSSQPLPAGAASPYVGASWLGDAARASTITGPTVDGRTGRSALLITVPVPGLGVAAAFVDLGSLAATAGELFGGARGLELLVTAGNGVIVTRWPDPGRWAGKPLRDSRFGSGTDVEGRRRVYARAGIEGTDWVVFAGADRAQALALAHRLARRQAPIAAAGLLAGLLATWLVYRSITRPIGRLRAAVRRASTSTGFDGTMSVAGPREISDLSTEFSNLLIAVDHELVERRRAEDTAREHERNYRQMFDASPFPMYLFDTHDLTIVAVNDAAVRYYGHAREELLAMSVTGLCPKDDAAAVEQAIRAAGPVDRAHRQRNLKRDGTVTEVDVTSHITSFNGRKVRCAVIDDVTEREHLDRRLRQSERLESLGQLAGGVAHDFNNLLGIINGYASMSAADVEPMAVTNPALRELHHDLLEIVAAGDRAAGLTRQLLAFARADAVTELRVLDLNTVVAGVEKLLRRTLGEDITLITELTDDSRPIKADAGRLEQVLVNLAVNARDAMPTGGTLTIDTDMITVDAHYAAHHPGLHTGRYARLRVSDTGEGMSKATLERAFEPFFTTKPKGHGTGLGLATIYGIITQFGGHAQIYSEPGHGTTFAALLPVTEETTDRGEPTPGDDPGGAGETILLVEDNDSLRALTERILDRHGYTVLSAATVDEARSFVATHPAIELLLTDVVMPDLHGPALAAEIHRERPGLPVIYMSGYAESILAARSALPDDVILLHKPVSARDLLAAIPRSLHPTAATARR
ncbi:hybrid sensor histidine kinase/response regulator [Virgisporangium aurantiacum]|uniref:hybrid sensor histidine kinase/response regulator n=1 Tax=Virgisporangium aurantiacum TaxID=175570 RepID=UPI00194FB5B6|nr:ATP-binding protein [Virgisporangium aurantiacum]